MMRFLNSDTVARAITRSGGLKGGANLVAKRPRRVIGCVGIALSFVFSGCDERPTSIAPLGVQTQGRLVWDSMLRHPALTDWLSYGRDLEGTHFSPLTGITRENVSTLQLAWAYDFGSIGGRLEGVPLALGGVLYVTTPWGSVVAIDGGTGALIWAWESGVPRFGGVLTCCGPVNRGVALYDGQVFVGLLDGRLVALDARSGDPRWERRTTPLESAYSITGAPRIVNGLVVIGNGGAEFGVRGYVTAYDANTGRMKWRVYTVPGDPNRPPESAALEQASRTWFGDWWRFGGGGTAWDGMSFDAEANQLYVGTGNGSPWSRGHRSQGRGDNLFLASILSLRPADGQLIWHYQVNPGEEWDYTATQNIILTDLTMDGRRRKVLMQAPKNGFFYVLDRITGELLSAQKYAAATWAIEVDLVSGRPIETTIARYGSTGAWISPGPRGAHSWPPMSWNPQTGLAYIPGENNDGYYRTSDEFSFSERRHNIGVGGPLPGTAPVRPPVDGPSGFLLAWNPTSQESVWRVPIDSPDHGGTLSTAGGLVFHAGGDGSLRAYDADTGDRLWEGEIAVGSGTPMSFGAGGQQFIAILAGTKLWAFTLFHS